MYKAILAKGLEDIKKLISNWHRSGTWKVTM